MIVSSRKAQNVQTALDKLSSQGLAVSGLVCHVGKLEDRQKLFDEVFFDYYACYERVKV